MKAKYLILQLFILLGIVINAQNVIKWYTIQEADSIRINEGNKKIFIYIYTDWCTYCKVMDSKTYANKFIAKFINTHFIPVKFNAESKESFKFKGQEYKWFDIGKRGINTFAYYLLGDNMSYPSSVIIAEDGTPQTLIIGFHPPDKFIGALKDIIK